MNFSRPLLIFGTLLVISCSSQMEFSSREINSIKESIITEDKDYIKGLSLRNAQNEPILYSINEDHLFTPASNIKLLTLFTSLHLIGDSLPLFQIQKEGNILHIRGNGNPAFLHPDFGHLQKDWLQQLEVHQFDTILYHAVDPANARFGPGWAWDDYPYYFQTEISGFPVFGNSLWVEWKVESKTFDLYPEYIGGYTAVRTNVPHKKVKVKRDEFANSFTIEMGTIPDREQRWSAPFLLDPYSVTQILQDTFKVPVIYTYTQIKDDWKDFYPITLDSVYSKMMFESDNFIAEHLLLAASGKLFRKLNSDSLIPTLMDRYLTEYAGLINWVDGSGLSRYNLTSPSFNTYLLHRIVEDFGIEVLTEYLPELGKEGNVVDGYEAMKDLGIHGKSGSLKHHYALSGVMLNGEQKVFFSIMYDNFLVPEREVQAEIVKALGALHHALKN